MGIRKSSSTPTLTRPKSYDHNDEGVILRSKSGDEEFYEPRRSNRIKKSYSQHDGDFWKERLAVIETASNKLLIRSHFQNSRTGEKVWDEPPTGATYIEPATATMRLKAEQRLEELQAEMEKRENTDSIANPSATHEPFSFKQRGILIRKINAMANKENHQNGNDNKSNMLETKSKHISNKKPLKQENSKPKDTKKVGNIKKAVRFSDTKPVAKQQENLVKKKMAQNMKKGNLALHLQQRGSSSSHSKRTCTEDKIVPIPKVLCIPKKLDVTTYDGPVELGREDNEPDFLDALQWILDAPDEFLGCINSYL